MAEMTISRRNKDLLCVIYGLSRGKGDIRPRDILAGLDITPSSVTEGLKNLQTAGLVEYIPYGSISLTDLGLHSVEVIKQSRIMLSRVLVLIGVEPSVADHDACIMEQELSGDSCIRVIKAFEFLEKNIDMNKSI